MTSSEICPQNACTGCSSCVNVCPKACISMQFWKDGHIYPVVDESKCIDCGLCAKTCPQNKKSELRLPIAAYAGWHTNHVEYLSSTSGGAATAIAQAIIKLGGIVYGCASQKGLQIQHIRIESEADLVRLKGSKYVQSNIGDTFKNVLADLKAGRTVLFIGTPCQVAGLKSFLRNDYDKLYCVDLICHGVPSQHQLKKHIHHVTGDKAKLVQFRKGNDMGLRLFDSKGEMIYYSNVWVNKFRDSYYGAFIDGYSYRESCYNCRYANPRRVSDVTIGDFWGLSKDVKHDEVNGCSCVLPITPKGLELVRMSNLKLIVRPVEEAVNGNSQLRHPSHKSQRAKLFRWLYPNVGYEAAYRLCELDRIINHRLIKPILRCIRL